MDKDGFTLRSGMRIAHYAVEKQIGAGGMGEVFRALDLTLERPVALKILPPKLLSEADRVRRFVQEAKSASALNHPNIVTIYEIGQATVEDPPGTNHTLHYMAMEFIAGSTLRAMIYNGTPLRDLLGVLAQAADGLAKAHAAGIVHRDLKPDNIMVTNDGFAKIVDFGLAKLTEHGQQKSADGITQSGIVVGTVGYMSPEQIGGEVIQPASDIFSFGCIVYECATRTRPFHSDLAIDTMHKIVFGEAAPLATLNAEVPPALQALVDRCLKKKPVERYASMKEVASALREIEGAKTPPAGLAAPVFSPPPEAARPVPRVEVRNVALTPEKSGGAGRRIGTIVRTAYRLAIAAAVGTGIYVAATMPDVAKLAGEPPAALAHASLGTWTDYGDIPSNLRKSAVAAADPKFYSRRGVSFDNLTTVARSVTTPERSLYVPSPIAVTVARQVYGGPAWNPLSPVRNWFIGGALQSKLPHKRLLELYLNVAPFGSTTGVADASKEFFRKAPEKLTAHEAALLAATALSSKYDPANPSEELTAAEASVMSAASAAGDEDAPKQAAPAETPKKNRKAKKESSAPAEGSAPAKTQDAPAAESAPAPQPAAEPVADSAAAPPT